MKIVFILAITLLAGVSHAGGICMDKEAVEFTKNFQPSATDQEILDALVNLNTDIRNGKIESIPLKEIAAMTSTSEAVATLRATHKACHADFLEKVN